MGKPPSLFALADEVIGCPLECFPEGRSSIGAKGVPEYAGAPDQEAHLCEAFFQCDLH